MPKQEKDVYHNRNNAVKPFEEDNLKSALDQMMARHAIFDYLLKKYIENEVEDGPPEEP
jgi:hypothetical protein